MAMCSNEMYFSLKSNCAEPLIVENLKIGPATAAPSLGPSSLAAEPRRPAAAQPVVKTRTGNWNEHHVSLTRCMTAVERIHR